MAAAATATEDERDTECTCADNMREIEGQYRPKGTPKSWMARCTYDGDHDCVCSWLLNCADGCDDAIGARALCRAADNEHTNCICGFTDPDTCDAYDHVCCCESYASVNNDTIACLADEHECVCEEDKNLCRVHDARALALEDNMKKRRRQRQRQWKRQRAAAAAAAAAAVIRVNTGVPPASKRARA